MSLVRMLANKSAEVQDKGKNEDLRKFFESIQEWLEKLETEFKTKNEI